MADGAEGYQVIRSLKSINSTFQAVPLERQLPGSLQLVKNSMTPALVPQTEIGQVLEVGGLDLHGITLLIATKGPLPAEIGLGIRVEELQENNTKRTLGYFGSKVFLTKEIQQSSFVFPAIPHSANKTIDLSFSLTEETKQEIRFLWHDSRLENDNTSDFFPQGYALINGKPVDADLFFISY